MMGSMNSPVPALCWAFSGFSGKWEDLRRKEKGERHRQVRSAKEGWDGSCPKGCLLRAVKQDWGAERCDTPGLGWVSWESGTARAGHGGVTAKGQSLCGVKSQTTKAKQDRSWGVHPLISDQWAVGPFPRNLCWVGNRMEGRMMEAGERGVFTL